MAFSAHGPGCSQALRHSDPRSRPLLGRFTASTHGKDDEYVYNELLEVSDEEFAELERPGQIGTTYPNIPR